MTLQRWLCALLPMLLTISVGMPGAHAQSPALMEDYVMPQELAGLQSQYSSIPDCMYEYVVHFHPPIEKVVRQFHYRFMTVRGMWRYERLDENGLVIMKLSFDGKAFYLYHKARHPMGEMLLILPNPPPEKFNPPLSSEFTWNPLFTAASMPFMARPAAIRIPDIHSLLVWKDVMRRSATRHAPPPGTPANQVHFLFDDEALNGILKLEKLNTPGLPPWRVVEHNYMVRASSAHVVTRYEGWTRFPLEEEQGADAKAVLHMPVLTTSTAKAVPQGSVVTIELLPNTVTRPPGKLSIDDFRIPRNVVRTPASVHDLTTLPADKTPPEVTRAPRPTIPSSTSGPTPDKMGGTELKPAPRLKPSPGLKPAPKL